MDVVNLLGIECRIVKEVTHEGQPARLVSGLTTFDTDLEDLWVPVNSLCCSCIRFAKPDRTA